MAIIKERIKNKEFEIFDSPYFEINGHQYVIVETKSIGRGYYNTIDVVKNDKGEYREFTRKELLEYIKKYTNQKT